MIYLGDNPIGLVTSIPIFSDKVQIEYGEYIPETNINLNTNSIQIFHNLGTEPNFFIFFTPNLEMVDTNDKAYVYYITFTPINNFTQMSYVIRGLKANSTSFGTVVGTHSMAEFIQDDIINNSYFTLLCSSSISPVYLKANTKYQYIVGKFKEVTSNA